MILYYDTTIYYNTINVYYKYHKGLCLFAIEWWPRLGRCIMIQLCTRYRNTEKCYNSILCNTRPLFQRLRSYRVRCLSRFYEISITFLMTLVDNVS